MNKNTMVANITTIGGIALCLGIAQLPLAFNIAVMSITGVGCGYLTNKESKR